MLPGGTIAYRLPLKDIFTALALFFSMSFNAMRSLSKNTPLLVGSLFVQQLGNMLVGVNIVSERLSGHKLALFFRFGTAIAFLATVVQFAMVLLYRWEFYLGTKA